MANNLQILSDCNYKVTIHTRDISSEEVEEEFCTLPGDFFKPCITMPLFMTDRSKQKYQKRPQTGKPKGLMATFPEGIIRAKENSNKKLWYDLYAPRSYIVKRAYETLYLQIPGSYISGNRYIHFNPDLPNFGNNRQRKCMRINNQLYVPVPIGFEGMIQQNQYLGFLKRFPLTRSVVRLTGNAKITNYISSEVYQSLDFEMINCRQLHYHKQN